MPQERGTEAAAEDTLEMGDPRLISKIRRSRQGEVVVGREEGMKSGMFERCNKGRNRWDIGTQPVQEITQ